MDYSDIADCFATPKHGVEPRKMVGKQRIRFMPWSLRAKRRRIVALRLALHRIPTQMRHAHCDAQRRLPVAMRLVRIEWKVPIRHAIEFADDIALSLLPRHANYLLDSAVFRLVGKHVDAWNVKEAIVRHAFAVVVALRGERLLAHQMSCED